MSPRHLGKAASDFVVVHIPRLKTAICLHSLSKVPGIAAHPRRAPGLPALSSMAQTVPKPLFFVLELCDSCARIVSKP